MNGGKNVTYDMSIIKNKLGSVPRFNMELEEENRMQNHSSHSQWKKHEVIHKKYGIWVRFELLMKTKWNHSAEGWKCR